MFVRSRKTPPQYLFSSSVCHYNFDVRGISAWGCDVCHMAVFVTLLIVVNSSDNSSNQASFSAVDQIFSSHIRLKVNFHWFSFIVVDPAQKTLFFVLYNLALNQQSAQNLLTLWHRQTLLQFGLDFACSCVLHSGFTIRAWWVCNNG